MLMFTQQNTRVHNATFRQKSFGQNQKDYRQATQASHEKKEQEKEIIALSYHHAIMRHEQISYPSKK